MFFTNGGDIKVDLVLRLDGDIGTESVVAGLLVVVFRCVIEREDFFSILLLLNPLQETERPLCSVYSLPLMRCEVP